MATLSFTVPDAKVDIIKEAMIGLYPIPKINTGTEDNPVWENEFTDNKWIKESIRRWIIKQVARYKQKSAQQAITYTEDDSLLS